MLPATSAVRASSVLEPRSHQLKRLWKLYGILGILLGAYVIWVFVRPFGESSVFVDGWCVCVFEVLLSGLCLARAVIRDRGRAVAAAFGFALLSWAIGDIVLTIQSLGGRTPPSPGLADLFYLAFYPIAYVAVVLFTRMEVKRLDPASWLDGAVAGLGAASLCAAFAFRSLLHSTGGGALSTATNLAYPIGDALLFALVIGGTTVLRGRRNATWALIAVACSVNAVGDTFNLFQNSVGGSRVGTAFNVVAWPTAILLISMSMWVRRRPSNPLATSRPPSFVLPGLAATCGVAILAVGAVHHLNRVALGLATATLIAAGVRLASSVGALTAITEHRHRQSITDELTGLGNRRFLFQVLDTFFADQNDAFTPARNLAFLFIDLVRFKEVNDSFGHPAGDELLRQLGPRLLRSLRESDVLVRFGGDEFAAVLVDADADYASSVAYRLLASLEEPFNLEVVDAQISASIGIALAPTDASESADLVRCADVAMYRARVERSAFEFFDNGLDDGGNVLRVIEELRLAVADRQFILHYQPQLDLRTGEIVAVEALLRWPHPRLGLVPPLKFLSLVEDAGLMPSVTSLVLDDALAQCAQWRGEGHLISVSVNVSSSNLRDPGFTELVRRQLEHHRLPAAALVLEITETCIITDYERSRVVIGELRDLGVIMSIDDFGAGFTSLAYLGDLPVGELKLDRTFVSGPPSGERTRDLELVRSTIALGHALGLRVVAEGIEDAVTLERLTNFGCDLAQGFFISMPKPPGELDLASAMPRRLNAAV